MGKNINRNDTDGNKLMIFSGIALYYGDNDSLLHSVKGGKVLIK